MILTSRVYTHSNVTSMALRRFLKPVDDVDTELFSLSSSQPAAPFWNRGPRETGEIFRGK